MVELQLCCLRICTKDFLSRFGLNIYMTIAVLQIFYMWGCGKNSASSLGLDLGFNLINTLSPFKPIPRDDAPVT